MSYLLNMNKSGENCDSHLLKKFLNRKLHFCAVIDVMVASTISQLFRNICENATVFKFKGSLLYKLLKKAIYACRAREALRAQFK